MAWFASPWDVKKYVVTEAVKITFSLLDGFGAYVCFVYIPIRTGEYRGQTFLSS